MSCREQRIRNLISEYIDGNTTVDVRREISRHLADCPDCRKLETEYRQVIAGLKTVFDRSAREHIANDVLVEYVDQPSGLAKAERKEIELHLDICPSCDKKVTMLRQVAEEPSLRLLKKFISRIAAHGRRLPEILVRRPVMALVTAVFLVVVVSGGYIITEHWAGGPQMEFLSAGNVRWLQELRRSDQEKPRVPVTDGVIQVGLSFGAFFDQEAYHVQLRSPDGETILEKQVRPTDLADGRGLRLRVTTAGLAVGEYRLVLVTTPLDGEGCGLEATYPFVLTGHGPRDPDSLD